MARSLVIVESPAKAKTINKYLGRNYNVKASYGHVMDLPKKTIGILLPGEQNGKKGKRKRKAKAGAPVKKPVKPVVVTSENIFEPTYEVIPSKLKVIGDLQKAASTAEAIYLAGDPDREGEAICAHLADKYAYGTLAPTRESPLRPHYLKWLFFDAGVLEPAMSMRRYKLAAPARETGWGDFETMVSILSRAVEGRAFIVGDHLTAADVVVGSSIQVGLFNDFLPRSPALVSYADRLGARPACKKASEATWLAAR